MRNISARWEAAILVCKKCTKKVGGGFGPKGKTSLAKALRATSNGKKGRKADLGVIETGCLKICPYNAVVAINATRPDQWLLAEPGADVEEVAEKLGLKSQVVNS